ncbi:MAG: hypothetical protein ABI851_00510 [Saprospiraceae bacterium]
MRNYQQSPLFEIEKCITTSIHNEHAQLGDNFVSVYPDPFVVFSKISFQSIGRHTSIQIIDNGGSKIKTVLDEVIRPGKYDLICDLEEAPPGLYYVRIQNGMLQQVKSLLKVNK